MPKPPIGSLDRRLPGVVVPRAERRSWPVIVRRLSAILIVSVAPTVAVPKAVATVPGGSGTIAFLGEDPVGYQHLFVMQSDGSAVTDLDPGYAGLDANPAWSPDGSRIAFRHGTGFGNGQIWLIDGDGANLTQLTTEAENTDDPSWSPDGLRIVYAAGAKLVVIGTDGLNRTALPSGDMPDWSPNGKRVTFTRYVNGYSDIFLMRPDGSQVTNITRSQGVSEFNPGWSPDGRTIVFQRSFGDHDIWTMRPDGSAQFLLTRDRHNHFDAFPSYSPDGTRIIFDRDGHVFSMNASGSVLEKILTDPVPDYATSWQPIACTIEGTAGNDDLFGTATDDVICGLGGDDVLSGLAGDDTIIGGGGSDRLSGGSGADVVMGLGGADSLFGNDGADRLAGGAGKDLHKGAGGPDYLFGWDYARGDVLRGGTGIDRCAYDKGDAVIC